MERFKRSDGGGVWQGISDDRMNPIGQNKRRSDDCNSGRSDQKRGAENISSAAFVANIGNNTSEIEVRTSDSDQKVGIS